MSIETKWTPGPWRRAQISQTSIEAENGRGVCSTGGYQQNFDSERVYRENHANAQLISAAPDLYEALAHAIGLIERPEGKAIRDDESWQMYGPAFHAALAKAEGRQP